MTATPPALSASESRPGWRLPLQYRIVLPLILTALVATGVATWISVRMTATALQIAARSAAPEFGLRGDVARLCPERLRPEKPATRDRRRHRDGGRRRPGGRDLARRPARRNRRGRASSRARCTSACRLRPARGERELRLPVPGCVSRGGRHAGDDGGARGGHVARRDGHPRRGPHHPVVRGIESRGPGAGGASRGPAGHGAARSPAGLRQDVDARLGVPGGRRPWRSRHAGGGVQRHAGPAGSVACGPGPVREAGPGRVVRRASGPRHPESPLVDPDADPAAAGESRLWNRRTRDRCRTC